MTKVLVSGCFDLLHAGHIAFLYQAATHGDLFVSVGSDANIFRLKGHRPLFTQEERAYVLNSLACVHQAKVCFGDGQLDFVGDLQEIRPDLFIVNRDGHTEAKRRVCNEQGVKYLIEDRVPVNGFPPRSSTSAKARLALPYRICIAGGWLDQPWISSIHPGAVITAQLEPSTPFQDRSGMATSTRKTAERIWGRRLPSGSPESIARTIFACENPPGTKYVSGSQDALGIACPGINRFYYDGEYWPAEMERNADPETIAWLESVVHLVEIAPRPDGYDPLLQKNITAQGVKRLSTAASLAWAAICTRDTSALGRAVSETADSWKDLLPLTVSDQLQTLRSNYGRFAGTSFSGCGGGYLLVVGDQPVENSIPIKVRAKKRT